MSDQLESTAFARLVYASFREGVPGAASLPEWHHLSDDGRAAWLVVATLILAGVAP